MLSHGKQYENGMHYVCVYLQIYLGVYMHCDLMIHFIQMRAMQLDQNMQQQFDHI